jgi:hypothetical protein
MACARASLGAVVIVGILTGAALGAPTLPRLALAQGGAPECVHAVCRYEIVWDDYPDGGPEVVTACSFLMNSTCWYSSVGQVACQPCNAQ